MCRTQFEPQCAWSEGENWTVSLRPLIHKPASPNMERFSYSKSHYIVAVFSMLSTEALIIEGATARARVSQAATVH